MPGKARSFPSLLLAFFLLLGAMVATAIPTIAESPIQIRPPVPRPTEVFEIRVTYSTSCPFLGIDHGVAGRVIGVTVKLDTLCLPGLPAQESRSVFVGPLAAGRYNVEVFLLHTDEQEISGKPMFFAAEDFAIDLGGDPGRLAIEPARPTPDDPVHLPVRTHCPAQTTVDPPTISDREITVIERVNNAILAACFEG